MIAAWMLYCIGIAVAFVVVGEALERALQLARRPIRWAWVVALVGSCAVPAAAWLRPQAFRTYPIPIAAPVAATELGGRALVDARISATGSPDSARPLSLANLDGALAWGWGLSSAAMLIMFLATALRLRRLQRHWRPETMDGRSVLVSEEVGPALAGLVTPRLVVPVWALGLAEQQRRLLLMHEEQHFLARDPWLLAFGTVALVVAPWNPALWWQMRRLRLAVEMDCDARVLAHGTDATAYGELLLRVGRQRGRAPLGAPALGEPPTFLERRIRSMVAVLPQPRWSGAAIALGIAAAAFVGACETPRPVLSEPRQEAQRAPAEFQGFVSQGDWVRTLARQYHPEVFAQPRPALAIALVFDPAGQVIGHAAGVREPHDADCLAVVRRLVPAYASRRLSQSGCADAGRVGHAGEVVVYWMSLAREGGDE